MSLRARLRRTSMGLATLAGWPRGFFSPYRYAARVEPTQGYPELEPVFRAAEPAMAEVLDLIARHRARLVGFRGPPPVPRWDQSWFPGLDGAAAYALVRRARPERIVEVGSGHSTRLLAQAVSDARGDPVVTEGEREHEQGRRAAITCIDPAPRADVGALGLDLHRRVLGEQDMALFAGLGAGDIAFFDSSHLLWEGSDVDRILNRILPALAPGVLVHLHDVTLPDPYPEAWRWRGYTEQLGLGGWLEGGGVEVLFASHYVRTRMADRTWNAMAPVPVPDDARETSLWLVRR